MPFLPFQRRFLFRFYNLQELQGTGGIKDLQISPKTVEHIVQNPQRLIARIPGRSPLLFAKMMEIRR
jgi:hypothetical protein